MRVYALMLGIMLTAGYGYTAQIAVSSLGAGHEMLAQPPAARSDAGGELWYGGVLDPVTVETRSVAPAKRGVLSRQTVRCVQTAPAAHRAVS